MIDTVVLTLMLDKFNITDHSRFSPSTLGLFNPPFYRLGGRGNFQCYQNPTATELKEGNYKPRLTVIKRMVQGGFGIALRIEFSVPKLIYGNNFDEVTVADFPQVVKTLHAKLTEMSVAVDIRDLVTAPVSAVHYSKNVILTDYSTPKMVLDEIRKANVSLKLDANEANYRNDGHLLKYHTNTFELVFYDKIKDLAKAKQSEKRAVEKYNSIQLGLFDNLRATRPFEVFRMELRLGTRKTITSELEAVGLSKDINFKELFSSVVSKAILLKHWQELTAYSPLSDQKPKSYSEYLTQVLQVNPKLKLNKAMLFIGTKVVIDEVGLRNYRGIISKFGSKAWHRINKEFEKHSFPKKQLAVLPVVEKQLQEFKPVKMSAYKSV